ncbi:MAG: ABC transporter substrate-binding protein [Oscillospiraceae bacterium]
MKKKVLLLLVSAILLSMVACAAPKGAPKPPITTEELTVKDDSPVNGTRIVTDMRGKDVSVPAEIKRVAILDKGFVVQTMAALGVEDLIVASGDLIQGAKNAEERDSLLLCPALLKLPQIGYPTAAVDYETLVSAKPDIVILRNSEYIKDSEITAEAISKLEDDLKIPLIVVNGPGCYDEVKLETQYEGVRLLGELFEKQERAEQIIKLMQVPIELIKERTKGIAEADKPTVMYIGGLKGEELTGTVWGENYGDAKYGAEIANIKNVHPVHESIRKVSAEQIITFNPEVIILCTVSPEPVAFLSDPLYASLNNITAVREKRVVSLGLLTWWGDFRLEAPTIMLISASGVYPELFKDIDLGKWLNDYHKELYGMTDAEAQQLKVTQQLDWLDNK